MSFFKKLFHKKEIKLQDVFDALDNFDNDVKTLQNFSEIAYQYFGNSWKFNLEMYISSLPPVEKEKYLSEFKQILDYERALSIWTSSLQIIKGVKPVSAELLKSMPEYKTYLAKFGIEGERLFEKLNAMFDIQKDIPSSISPDIEVNEENIKPEENEIDNNKDVEAKEDTVSNMESEKTDSEDEEVNDSLDAYSVSKENQEYHKKLKQRILEKVRDIELRKKSVDVDKNTSEPITPVSENVSKEEISEMTEEIISNPQAKDEKITEIKEETVVETNKKDEKSIKNPSIDNKKASNHEENIDWILKNFIKISDFLSESRKGMSAISIYKKASTLEEYKNYGFILDVIDYLIDKGNQILSTKSDAEIEQVFAGGREELISIIDSYKKEKNNEIVFAESDNNDAKKSK